MDIENHLGRLVDDPDFILIVKHRSKFNIFEAVGAIRGELRHSNFLAFLLNPSSNHGLGSEPLKRFLRLVLADMPPDQRPLSTLEIIVGDLDNAVIERERANIDLLIRIKEINLLVVIENKISAKASDGQLRRYRDHVEKEFSGWRRLMIFLTPDGDEPDEDGYQALSYSDLANLISGITQEIPANDAQIAIHHYIEMLRRHIVPDQKLNELALQLYNRHKTAFDFVNSVQSNSKGYSGLAKELRDSAEQVVADNDTPTHVRFVPKSWNGRPELTRCAVSDWTKSGRHLIFEIITYKTEAYRDRVNLALIVGPAPDEDRTKLWEAARDREFSGLVPTMGAKWATIWSRDLLSQKSGASMEPNVKKETIEAEWNKFLESDLPSLEAAILEIIGSKG